MSAIIHRTLIEVFRSGNGTGKGESSSALTCAKNINNNEKCEREISRPSEKFPSSDGEFWQRSDLKQTHISTKSGFSGELVVKTEWIERRKVGAALCVVAGAAHSWATFRPPSHLERRRRSERSPHTLAHIQNNSSDIRRRRTLIAHLVVQREKRTDRNRNSRFVSSDKPLQFPFMTSGMLFIAFLIRQSFRSLLAALPLPLSLASFHSSANFFRFALHLFQFAFWSRWESVHSTMENANCRASIRALNSTISVFKTSPLVQHSLFYSQAKH